LGVPMAHVNMAELEKIVWSAKKIKPK